MNKMYVAVVSNINETISLAVLDDEAKFEDRLYWLLRDMASSVTSEAPKWFEERQIDKIVAYLESEMDYLTFDVSIHYGNFDSLSEVYAFNYEHIFRVITDPVVAARMIYDNPKERQVTQIRVSR